MIRRIGRTLAPLLPDALPVGAAGAALAGGAAAGVPPWLMALAQAAIVVVWTSRAVERKNEAQARRLERLERLINRLACLRGGGRGGEGCATPIPSSSTPAPVPTQRKAAA